MILHETAHLAVDDFGRCWLLGDHWPGVSFVYLGCLVEGMDWPEHHGAEPDWWQTEAEELFDRWIDAALFACECRAQADADYLRKEGML